MSWRSPLPCRYERSTASRANPARSATRWEPGSGGGVELDPLQAQRIETPAADQSHGAGGVTPAAGLAPEPVADLATGCSHLIRNKRRRSEQRVSSSASTTANGAIDPGHDRVVALTAGMPARRPRRSAPGPASSERSPGPGRCPRSAADRSRARGAGPWARRPAARPGSTIRFTARLCCGARRQRPLERGHVEPGLLIVEPSLRLRGGRRPRAGRARRARRRSRPARASGAPAAAAPGRSSASRWRSSASISSAIPATGRPRRPRPPRCRRRPATAAPPAGRRPSGQRSGPGRTWSRPARRAPP